MVHSASRPTQAICALLYGAAILSCATSQGPARSPTTDEHPVSTKAPEPAKRLLSQPIERVLPRLNKRFGINTVADLKRAIPEELSRTSRVDAWLLRQLFDFPSIEQVYGHLLLKDPYDLEAAYRLAETQYTLGDLEGALVTLRRTPPEKLILRDGRASGLLRQSGIKSLECEILRLQGKTPQARQACENAIRMGSKVTAPFLLAELLFLAGDDSTALQHVAARIEVQPDFGTSYFLQGLIYSQLHRSEDARKAWLTALAKNHGYTPARMALDGNKLSRAEWLNVDDQFRKAETAEELSFCGHFYLDLDIPDRAETCFRAADQIVAGPAAAQRILHKAETDPAGALRDADAVMKTVSHQDVQGAVARIYLAQQRAGEALKWAEEALYRDSQNPKFNQLATEVCSALKDQYCIVHYRAAHPRSN